VPSNEGRRVQYLNTRESLTAIREMVSVDFWWHVRVMGDAAYLPGDFMGSDGSGAVLREGDWLVERSPNYPSYRVEPAPEVKND